MVTVFQPPDIDLAGALATGLKFRAISQELKQRDIEIQLGRDRLALEQRRVALEEALGPVTKARGEAEAGLINLQSQALEQELAEGGPAAKVKGQKALTAKAEAETGGIQMAEFAKGISSMLDITPTDPEIAQLVDLYFPILAEKGFIKDTPENRTAARSLVKNQSEILVDELQTKRIAAESLSGYRSAQIGALEGRTPQELARLKLLDEQGGVILGQIDLFNSIESAGGKLTPEQEALRRRYNQDLAGLFRQLLPSGQAGAGQADQGQQSGTDQLETDPATGAYLIEDDEDFNLVPSGSNFIGPDGVMRTKP